MFKSFVIVPTEPTLSPGEGICGLGFCEVGTIAPPFTPGGNCAGASCGYKLTSIGQLDGGAPGAGIAVFPPKASAADLKAPAKTSPLTAGLTTSL